MADQSASPGLQPMSLQSWSSGTFPPFCHVLTTRYPGEEGGSALAALLFGTAQPSGRMPVTTVAAITDLPPYLDLTMHTPPGRTHRYFTGVPIYPFGYGLTYGVVAYARVVVPASVRGGQVVAVSVDVVHQSGMAVEEVVQIYVALSSPAPRAPAPLSAPLQDLRAFLRVAVPVGGTVTAKLAFDVCELQLAVAGGVALVPGVYTLWAGGVSPTWRTPYTAVQGVGAPIATSFVVEGGSC
jgi:beta-glucosidase